jgi:probable F420-dependent oxidoreductase
MGPEATRACLLHCARRAEELGLDHIWAVDHIAIPPDDAEGSNGRYLDPLAVLAFLAAATERIGLGVSVLVLPYRPALPTAKWIATIQELSGGRLHFGIGAGWMAPEFRALGIDRTRRGQITDDTIDFVRGCFGATDDIVEAHGQPFLFRPRPARPPIYVGGMNEPALRRAVRIGDGWMPMGVDPEKLRPKAARLTELAQSAGRDALEIILIGGLPADQTEAEDTLRACVGLGATQYIQASRYASESEFDRLAERLADLRERLQ